MTSSEIWQKCHLRILGYIIGRSTSSKSISHLQLRFSSETKKQSINISMVTVVEFHNEAGEIQYVFESQWTPLKDFFIR